MDGTLLDSMQFWKFCPELYIKAFGIKPEPGLGEKLFSMSMKQGAEFLNTISIDIYRCYIVISITCN